MSLILECVTYVRERLLPMSKVYTPSEGDIRAKSRQSRVGVLYSISSQTLHAVNRHYPHIPAP
jgi:hypothetical protein